MKNTKFKWLIKQRKTTISELARVFGCSRVHLTDIANGLPAGKRIATLIVEWSDGELSFEDIMQLSSK